MVTVKKVLLASLLGIHFSVAYGMQPENKAIQSSGVYSVIQPVDKAAQVGDLIPREDKATQTLFSAENFGVDLWLKEAVVDFYRDRIKTFQNYLPTIFAKPSDEQISALDQFMYEVEGVSEGSKYDLNADGIAREFAKLIDNADAARNELLKKQQREQEELAEKDRKIVTYRDSVKKLKEELMLICSRTKVDLHKQQIACLHTIINQAQSISEKSKQELHEVDFAHEVAPIIKGAWNMINALDNDTALDNDVEYVHASSRAKREKENVADLKRSKTY